MLLVVLLAAGLVKMGSGTRASLKTREWPGDWASYKDSPP